VSDWPKGQPEVAYVVRDEQGRVLEIATEDGQRIYVDPAGQQPEVPGEEAGGE
jgi:hypothetical protein